MAYRFRYVLALALGKSLKEIDSLDSQEFSDWLGFYQFSPFGDFRDDMRGALLCSVVSNLMGGKTKPSEYMPDWFGDRPPVKLATADSLRAMARLANANMGGA